MSKMIRLRNVPDDSYRALKSRAALAGLSLPDYLLSEIREIAARPTLAKFRERLHQRKSLSLRADISKMIRNEREERGFASTP